MTGPKKVIIIEDEEPIRRLYRTIFLREGFDVRAYGDAVEIVAKAAGFKPTVILVDLLMPKIDGFNTIKLLKNDRRTKAIPIMVISNLGDEVRQQKAAYLGAGDFIVKADFKPADLVRRVNDFVAGKTPAIRIDEKIISFIKAEEKAQQQKLEPETYQHV